MRGKSDRSGTRARYLRAIWSLTENSDAPVTVTGIARALSFVPGSVSEQVKRLVDDGLVDHERYKSLSLTPTGHLEAMRAVRTNRILRCFLHDALDLPWSELAANADALEASSSPRFLQRIEASLDQPTHDPYGQPIPTPDGHIESRRDARLRELARPRWAPVRITRVADAPLETLVFLDERHPRPDTRSRIQACTAENDIIKVRSAGWHGTLLPAGAGVLHASLHDEAAR
ncbi:metal-dependent transcriptional regulator [Micrococcus luteus]|nr:metal-dependent transcriptional regulator [Micrococcus luteus]MCR4488341.1 metal-dependent transcriptional regulator [Micrococcus luteus]